MYFSLHLYVYWEATIYARLSHEIAKPVQSADTFFW
jgi:hypothetical protein